MLQGLRLQRLPSVQPGIALAMRALAIAIVVLAASIALLVAGEDPLALGAQLVSATFSSTFGME
ncbi:MAG: ABC transporter permease, partial [Mesorhizobium sp.]